MADDPLVVSAGAAPSSSVSASLALLTDDRAIVERIRSGDEATFDMLVRSHYNGLCVFAARMMDSDAAAEELVQEVLFREVTGRLPQRFSPDAALHAIRQRTHATFPHPHPRPRVAGVGSPRSGRWVAARVAAMLSLLVAGSIVAWQGARRSGTLPIREFTSAAGGRATVTLRDGTRLVLGPATRLRVPSDFGVSTRTVDLTGEALFAVVHDAARPFAVRTARVIVRDVGTTFVVRSYVEDMVDRVAVEEGQVVLGGCGPASPRARSVASTNVCMTSSTVVALRAGDLATAGGTSVSVRHGAHLAPLTAWVQGGLSFEDTPFREVVHDIDRAFGVHITVADSALLGKPVTGTFADQPLDVILDAVTQVVGGRYERTEHGIVIRDGMTGAREPIDGQRAPLTTARAGDPRK